MSGCVHRAERNLSQKGAASLLLLRGRLRRNHCTNSLVKHCLQTLLRERGALEVLDGADGFRLERRGKWSDGASEGSETSLEPAAVLCHVSRVRGAWRGGQACSEIYIYIQVYNKIKACT